MPSNPTTKSQVQAYQFVLRRMQSALVRKDSVMLHDPMRTHSRATIVGVVLSALAVLGFVIFGFFKPSPAVPDSGNIVIGEQSGAIYVVMGTPKKLVPTFNLASARLLLMAQKQQDQQGGASAAGQGGGAPTEVVQPKVIPDDQLVDIARERPRGIPNAPHFLPGEGQRISPTWAVCDNIMINKDLPEQQGLARATNETTVLGGVSELGRELANNEALLVSEPGSGQTYLVYRLPEDPNRPTADVVRAKVDMSDGAVRQTFGLASAQPRQVSMALLNAIPQTARPLSPPDIPGAGDSVQWDLDGTPVGGVFYTSTGSEGREYWVVTKNGIQSVSAAVADLIRADNTQIAGDIPSVPPDQISNVPTVEPGEAGYLPVGEFPAVRPTVLKPREVPSTCLGWKLEGEGANREAHTTVYVGGESPTPKNEKGEPNSLPVAEPSPDRYKIDQFYMPPGKAAVVRSATSESSFDKGPIQMISAQGVRYGVPDQATAQGLGLTPQDPAPESIIRLLPTGASLNTQDVLREFSSNWVVPGAGTFPSQPPQAAGG